jgi:rSAM/selenodomain-associated transferase 2
MPIVNSLSIILPVRNEANLIRAQLQALQPYRAAGHELIVVDGGSSDATLENASGLADQCLSSAAGRSQQMNLGARAAGNRLLLFLHVDTVLPANADQLLVQALQSQGCAWGWFDVRLSNTALPYTVIAAMMNLRARLSSVCTGDQALFVEKALFTQLGGFPAIELMEDVAISKLLRASGRAARPAALAISSSRRWEQKGLFATIGLMWTLRLLYFLGIKPARLRQMYYPRHD